MAQPQPEKRSARRFALELPITITSVDHVVAALNAQARDASSRGVFMYLDAELAEGTTLEFIMTVPREITKTDRVRCTGRVLRRETREGRKGIAVSIDDYDFVS